MGSQPDDDTWRFGLDDVDENGVVEEETTIEPESPDLENAVFVLLGVVGTLLLLFGGF